MDVVDYKYAYTKTGETHATYNAENRISKIRTDYKYAMQVKPGRCNMEIKLQRY